MSNMRRVTGDENLETGFSPTKGMAMSAVSLQSNFSIFTSKTYLSGLSLLSLQDLKLHYEKCLEDLKTINIENYLLEKYLLRVRPKSLQEITSCLDAAEEVKKRLQKMSQKMSSRMSVSPSDSDGTEPYDFISTDKRRTLGSTGMSGVTRSALKAAQFSSDGTIIGSGEKRRTLGSTGLSGATRSAMKATQSSMLFYGKLTYAFRADLVTHEIEDIESRMVQFHKQCKIKKFKLRADSEERTLAKKNIRAIRKSLQDTFNKVEASTGHITAEKYLKTINDLLNSTEQEAGKIKLKIAALHRMYSHLKLKLLHVMELGETIHEVDFEELKLENKDYALDLEQKNKNLVELKRVTGFCTLNLNVKKRCLDDLKTVTDQYDREIKTKENLINKHTDEIIKSIDEIDKAQRNNSTIKSIIDNYTAPSVVDYARTKSNLRTVQKNLKIWSRRVHLQDVTIKLLKKRLKNKSNSVYNCCSVSSAPVMKTGKNFPKKNLT